MKSHSYIQIRLFCSHSHSLSHRYTAIKEGIRKPIRFYFVNPGERDLFELRDVNVKRTRYYQFIRGLRHADKKANAERGRIQWSVAEVLLLNITYL